MFRVRGKVKKLLGDEEGALNDLTVADLLDYDTTVRTCSPSLVRIVILDNPSLEDAVHHREHHFHKDVQDPENSIRN